MPRAKRIPKEVTLSEKLLPEGHIQITISGPPEHVRATLTSMAFMQTVSPLLCIQIAIQQTGIAGAQPGSDLNSLNMHSPESRTGYAERCVLSLNAETGANISSEILPQDATTLVQQVAEAMFDAAT